MKLYDRTRNTPWSNDHPSMIKVPSDDALAPQLQESVLFPAQNAARADMKPLESTRSEEEG